MEETRPEHTGAARLTLARKNTAGEAGWKLACCLSDCLYVNNTKQEKISPLVLFVAGLGKDSLIVGHYVASWNLRPLKFRNVGGLLRRIVMLSSTDSVPNTAKAGFGGYPRTTAGSPSIRRADSFKSWTWQVRQSCMLPTHTSWCSSWKWQITQEDLAQRTNNVCSWNDKQYELCHGPNKQTIKQVWGNKELDNLTNAGSWLLAYADQPQFLSMAVQKEMEKECVTEECVNVTFITDCHITFLIE